MLPLHNRDDIVQLASLLDVQALDMGVHGLPIIVVLLNPFQPGPQRQTLTGCGHAMKVGCFSHAMVCARNEGYIIFPSPLEVPGVAEMAANATWTGVSLRENEGGSGNGVEPGCQHLSIFYLGSLSGGVVKKNVGFQGWVAAPGSFISASLHPSHPLT